MVDISLNQACAGLWPALAWFLKIVSERMSVCVFVCVCLCVCPPLRLLITSSGVMWHDMDPIQLVKQVLQLYMATVIIIINERGLEIGNCRTH